MDEKEAKLTKILQRLNEKSKLMEFIHIDERGSGQVGANKQLDNSHVNENIEMDKGVEMRNKSGLLLKSGGKYMGSK